MNKLLLLPALLLACSAFAADPVLSPDAPKDRPFSSDSPAAMEARLAPYVARARASYPQARKRYLAGLPEGEHFFITTRLVDPHNRAIEQVFLAVTAIEGERITGRIWSELVSATSFRRGQLHTISERELVDWLITKPDGSEEGNVVGKYIDTLHR